jgi:hypothetical protein
MRGVLFLFVVLSAAVTPALSQDPGLVAAQQANQIALQTILDASYGCACCPFKYYGTWLPRISVKPGLVKPGTAVRIKWRASDFAWVYYSTDGSTPTTKSAIYKGPIFINGPTHLQAIAAAPGLAPSKVFDAYYDVAPSKTPAKPVSP